MNRFNKNFHDVDAETSRPFSAGHPDGVWIISIIYFLPIVISILAFAGAALKALTSDSPDWGSVNMMGMGLLGAMLLIGPAVLLLFKRSKKAVDYSLFLAVLFLLSCSFVYLNQPDKLLMPIIVLLFQVIAVYYIWGLRKDNLLR